MHLVNGLYVARFKGGMNCFSLSQEINSFSQLSFNFRHISLITHSNLSLYRTTKQSRPEKGQRPSTRPQMLALRGGWRSRWTLKNKFKLWVHAPPLAAFGALFLLFLINSALIPKHVKILRENQVNRPTQPTSFAHFDFGIFHNKCEK